VPGACAVGRRLGGGVNNPLWPGLGHVRVWRNDPRPFVTTASPTPAVSPCSIAARAGP
jgi:hypothetical protein